MELKKLMEHISITPDYRQAWKVEHKVADYPHLMLTSCTGEVGAASGPLMLAYLASVMSRTDGPGKKGLLHLSADNGQRAAAIVRERAWCAVGTKMQNGTFCM